MSLLASEIVQRKTSLAVVWEMILYGLDVWEHACENILTSLARSET